MQQLGSWAGWTLAAKVAAIGQQSATATIHATARRRTEIPTLAAVLRMISLELELCPEVTDEPHYAEKISRKRAVAWST